MIPQAKQVGLRSAGRHSDGQSKPTDRYAYGQTDTDRQRWTKVIQTDRQIHRQTDRHTDRLTD